MGNYHMGRFTLPRCTIATEIAGLDIILPTRVDPLMVSPPTLRQGQFWYHQGASTEQKTVVEIMQVEQDEFQYRMWTPNGQRNAQHGRTECGMARTKPSTGL